MILPPCATVWTYLSALLSLRPQMLALNCNLTKMSIIDINGVLSFFDLEAKGGSSGTQGEHLAFERKVGGPCQLRLGGRNVCAPPCIADPRGCLGPVVDRSLPMTPRRMPGTCVGRTTTPSCLR